ncbi:MAG TPA: NUDIX domain-containing protein [Rhizomicrobium sp.]|nr:NUDIX domain-containing protein [Rhizomicrobium sp.]
MTRANFHACGFLYDAARRAVLLHLRDGNTSNNPNRWAFFGGLNEGDETHVECFLRELREEIGLTLEKSEARYLREYPDAASGIHRVVFYAESAVREEALVLGEGAGFQWIALTDLTGFDLTENTRDDIAYFAARVLGE